MNCEDFERLMADALGGELSPEDRPRFDRHLAECEACRKDFETSRRALDEMHALPGSRKVTARREGSRIIIDAADLAAAAFLGASRGHRSRWAWVPLRYAAGLLIAFTAGYALHAGLTLADAARSTPMAAHQPRTTGESLHGSLVRAHANNPGRSNLAKCLIAMAPTRR